ncbi:hypothetical protein Godav_021875 [Gossypium davidsonii]|uniref:Uncharacterized protein n=1 Tax=Gossypium davidsonii TaxID=34287 RepID=A0A7J8TCW0_GOSDV|nr:hypothetical protein [Gossypium davidsonii]
MQMGIDKEWSEVVVEGDALSMRSNCWRRSVRENQIETLVDEDSRKDSHRINEKFCLERPFDHYNRLQKQ